MDREVFRIDGEDLVDALSLGEVHQARVGKRAGLLDKSSAYSAPPSIKPLASADS